MNTGERTPSKKEVSLSEMRAFLASAERSYSLSREKLIAEYGAGGRTKKYDLRDTADDEMVYDEAWIERELYSDVVRHAIYRVCRATAGFDGEEETSVTVVFSIDVHLYTRSHFVEAIPHIRRYEEFEVRGNEGVIVSDKYGFLVPSRLADGRTAILPDARDAEQGMLTNQTAASLTTTLKRIETCIKRENKIRQQTGETALSLVTD